MARKGDNKMCIFQCEVCYFRNMRLRNLDKGGSDRKIMRYIRRVNRDAFWVSRPGILYNIFLEIRATIKDADKIAIISAFPEIH